MSEIYFVLTTIGSSMHKTRSVGIFQELKEAEDVLTKNYGDLYEAGTYPYAIIEPLEYGLYPVSSANKRLWWKFNNEKNHWERLDDEPEVLKKQHLHSHLASWSNIG